MEKKNVTLDCVYETSETTYSLYWYKQPPSGEMVVLVRQDSYNKENATAGRYSLNFQKSAGYIGLTLRATQVQDLAVYFCTLQGAQWEECVQELHKNLSNR